MTTRPKRTHHQLFRTLSLSTGLAAALFAGCVSSAYADCPAFTDMIDAALPAAAGNGVVVGAMLAAQGSPDPFVERFAHKGAGKIFSEGRISRVVAGECPSRGGRRDPGAIRCTFSNRDGSLLRVDLTEGAVSYMNPARTSAALESGDHSILGADALTTVVGRAIALGVPASEVALSEAQVRNVIMARSEEGVAEINRRKAYVDVRIPREVGGFPVLGSGIQAAVGPDGGVARMHIRWPTFRLASGLVADDALDRAQLIDRVKSRLEARIGCSKLAGLKAGLGYVEADRVTHGDDPETDDDTENPDRLSHTRMVPALVVQALPPTTTEDAGEIAGFLREYTISLFD